MTQFDIIDHMFDVPRSLAAATTIDVETKACYKNALLTLLTCPDFRHGWYVEGFAAPLVGGIRLPLEHGWVQLPDGSVIDVSLAVLGHTDVAYFPAIRVSWRRARQLVAEEAELPYLLSAPSPRHRAAYCRAQAAAYRAIFGQ